MVKKKINNIKYLIVGKNHHFSKMKKKAGQFPDIIFTGWIDNVEDFFAITDIGSYPVSNSIYDNCRCPIKILEYSYLGKPVVTANINEVLYWNFPNLFISSPNKIDFSKKIIEANNSKYKLPNLEQFEIKYLSDELIKILNDL